MVWGAFLLLIAIILHINLPDGIDERFFIYFPLYAIGMLIARSPFVEWLTTSRLICLACLVAAVASFFMLPRYDWFLYVFVPAGIVVVLRVSRLLEHPNLGKVVTFVAYSSMCAYLFHRQIYIVIDVIVSGGKGIPLWAMLILVLPMCIVISFIIQKMYDKVIKLV